MANRNDLDIIEQPLRKDDLGNPTHISGRLEYVTKFGLSTANDGAPAGAVVSNIYEPEDEYQNLYIGASRDQGLIQPPYYMRTLDRLTQENNALAPCIEAMMTNIDGTGFDFENQNKTEVETEDAADDAQIAALNDFFREPWPGMSFRTMRKLLRRDLERVGNGFLEVLRNPQDQIVMLRHVDAKMMRMVRLDDPVAVKKTVIRGGKPVTITVMIRERRFTQDVNGISLVYFKEFGASRDINKNTGLWIAQGSRLPANVRGSEIMHFIAIPDAHTPYGIPRWVNQLPSILGSRKAEEFNLEFFDNGGLPPVMILVQGGALANRTKQALDAKMSGTASRKNRVQIIEVEPSTGSMDQQSLTRVTVERFGSERQNDSMFEKYDERCEERVRRSFRLPPIFVGSSTDYNFATAFASYTVTEAQVFKPERQEFDEIITMQLLPVMGFQGYAMRSNPLTIDDATLKLQGIQVAISTNVVNDSDVLEEINIAIGTNMKADPKLVTLKSNQAMGLNPDGSKPPVQIPGVQGLPGTALAPNPGVQRDEQNIKSPTGETVTEPGKPITPVKVGANAQPGKGNPAKAPGKGAASPGNGKNVGKVKKTDAELTALATRLMKIVHEKFVADVGPVMREFAELDDDERSILHMMALGANAVYKDDRQGRTALQIASDTLLKGNGLPRPSHATETPLQKGKSAPSPVFNGGDGALPPEAQSSDPFGQDFMNPPPKKLDRFVSAMGNTNGK